MDYDQLLRRHRKKPLAEPGSLSPLALGRESIARIIPHREPFLFLDRLTGVDLEQELIEGERTLSEEDPVFRGHFPEYPLYPGSLQLETIGQLGLCLYHFLRARSTRIDAEARPAAVRATRLLGAYYLEPVRPGATLRLLARKVSYDGYFGTVLGQSIAAGSVACVMAMEVCFLE